MKKLILCLGILGLSIGPILTVQVSAACYEPYYPAQMCDSQGFDNCVNYDCKTPDEIPPACGEDEDCNSDLG